MVSRLVSANKFKAAEDLVASENTLLSICRGYGRVHRAFDSLRVFHKMKDFDCDRRRKGREAANFLDEMILEGITPNRSTYVKTSNEVVRGLCTSYIQLAHLTLYLSMRSRGISVEVETLDSLLVKCLYKKS